MPSNKPKRKSRPSLHQKIDGDQSESLDFSIPLNDSDNENITRTSNSTIKEEKAEELSTTKNDEKDKEISNNEINSVSLEKKNINPANASEYAATSDPKTIFNLDSDQPESLYLSTALNESDNADSYRTSHSTIKEENAEELSSVKTDEKDREIDNHEINSVSLEEENRKPATECTATSEYIDPKRISNEEIFDELKELKNICSTIMERIERLEDTTKKLFNPIKKQPQEIESTRKTYNAPINSRRNRYEPTISPVAILVEQGEQKLQNELDQLSNSELQAMSRFFTKISSKEIKKLDRESLILKIINYAKIESKRGEKFLEYRE